MEIFGLFNRFCLTLVNGAIVIFDAYVCDVQGYSLPVFSCLPGMTREGAKTLALQRTLPRDLENFQDFVNSMS